MILSSRPMYCYLSNAGIYQKIFHPVMLSRHKTFKFITPVAASASNCRRGKSRQEKISGRGKYAPEAHKKLIYLPFVCLKHQIWSNFNTFVIILEGKGGGEKIFLGGCPHAPLWHHHCIAHYLLDLHKVVNKLGYSI